jgi:AcrR family transcriptional regulator
MTATEAPVGLRERKRQRTRDAIVEAAMHLFATRDYNDVSVEEIAAAAEVSPRTFYRYFPAKEDVLIDTERILAPTLEMLAHRPPGESDVDALSRAMLAGVAALDPDHLRLAHGLVDTVPALQARLYQLIWRGGHDQVVDALLAGRRRTADADLRARVLTHAVADAMQLGVMSWLQSGRRGSLALQCRKALDHLRQGFTDGA